MNLQFHFLNKKYFYIILIILGFIGFMPFSACEPPTPTPTPTTDSTKSVQEGGKILTGTISKNLTIAAGNYNLKGVVEVESGVTLTIAAGSNFTVLDAYKDLINVLVIKQGAKIIAKGTETAPIVFTSQTKQSGKWGGILIMGKSTINVKGGTAQAEAGGYTYGGTDAADNSGELAYVRVEYAGSQTSDGKSEYNAISFFGVGSGTKLSYLEAYKGADDGFEFFGGTVKGDYLVAIDCEDDSFDWDQGWSGTGNQWIAQQHDNSDNGIEASNNPTEFNNTPLAKPTITGLTIKRKAARADGKTSVGITFKDGTGGILENVHISGVKQGVLLGDSTTAAYVVADPTRLKMTKVNITATDKIVAYRTTTIPVIPGFPSANDATVTGAATNWVEKSWVVGYTK